MKQIFQDFRGGTLLLADVPAPALRPGGVLVRARYSLISPGTERHALETSRKNLIGKARERPDLVRQVLDKARREGIVPAYRAVIGLGLVGQITASLLKANGCRVISIDLDPSRVSLALERGIDNALNGAEDLAREAARRTGAGGVDGVVITASSGSNEALELAI